MLVAGLTGSIGMGKSTLAAHLRDQGVPVCDADAEVHRLYSGKAAPLIEAAFPGAVADGIVDRAKLSAALARDPLGFERLNAIMHPLVREAERDFLRQAAASGAQLAVLEIPLLFETGGDRLVDAVILASAPENIRRARVLQRPGMTPEKLDLILSRQASEADKIAKADFVIDTGTDIAASLKQLDAALDALKRRKGLAFQRHWSA